MSVPRRKRLCKRTVHREESNNPSNTNKNICALAVAKNLNVSEEVRYLHTMDDVVGAARRKWVVRSRTCAFKIKQLAFVKTAVKGGDVWPHEGKSPVAYIVYTPGHVLLLNGDGTTNVDTAGCPPHEPVNKVYAVFTK